MDLGYHIHAQSGTAGSERAARIQRALAARRDRVDQAGTEVQTALESVADDLAEALREFLTAKAGGTETARIKAAAQATKLDDILEVLRQVGAGTGEAGTLDAARQAWLDQLGQLALDAETTLGAVGIDHADRILDGEAASAALAARYEDAASTWDAHIVRPLADRVLQGLRSSARLESLDEAVTRIAANEGASIFNAVTEARTRTAEFDRWVSAEAAELADPDGTRLMWAYTGPDDGIERPFCDALNGKFFTRAELLVLNNQQFGHPIDTGGGYRCRHQWLQAVAKVLESIGYSRGGAGDIAAANAGAMRH